VPEHYAEVERPAKVRVRYLDYQNELREIEAEGMLGTCLQHEMDHLDGILFIDRITALKRNIILRKLLKAKKAAKKKAPAKKKKAAKKKAAKKKGTKKKAAKKKAPAKKRTPNAAFMRAMTPSAALAAVIGDKAIPRTEVTKKVWDYIKKNKLQDAVNKRMINADEKLKSVFGGKRQVSMFEMTRLIAGHLK